FQTGQANLKRKSEGGWAGRAYKELSEIWTAHQFAREFDGFDDLRIGRTAAKVAGEIVRDFVVTRIGDLLKQLMSHENKAGRAETALEGARIDEGLLHRRKLTSGIEMLDGGDALSINLDSEIEAARHSRAVDKNRTAAAKPLTAAFTRAKQPL